MWNTHHVHSFSATVSVAVIFVATMVIVMRGNSTYRSDRSPAECGINCHSLYCKGVVYNSTSVEYTVLVMQCINRDVNVDTGDCTVSRPNDIALECAIYLLVVSVILWVPIYFATHNCCYCEDCNEEEIERRERASRRVDSRFPRRYCSARNDSSPQFLTV